ncbi:MAG: hypothetical protein ACFFG0_28350 [Candidatus Thorarchaeota archaeon]
MDILNFIFGNMNGPTIAISLVSLVTTLLGLYALGEKYKSGFMLYNISLICQMVLFYTNRFIVIQLIVLMIFNFRNYYKWGKEE